MEMIRRLLTLCMINLLISQYAPVLSNDEFSKLSESERAIVDSQYAMMDAILEDLLQRYETIETDNFWHPYVFGTGADNREGPSPIFDQSMTLYGEFKRLSQQMDLWRIIVSEAEATLANKLNTDGNNEITGSWSVNAITTKDVEVEGRDANSDGVFNVLKFGDVHITEEDFSSTNEDIMEKMEEMDRNMASIMSVLEDALLNNFVGKQTVNSEIVMTGNLIVEHATADNIEVTTLEEQNTQLFFNSLANKNDNVTNVEGGLVFSQPLRLNVLHTDKINRVLVEDFAILTEDNVFRCQSTFETIEALNDIQTEMVNGKDLAQSVVMAHDITGLHFIDGLVAFNGAETVNKYPFDDVLLRSTPQTVVSPVSLDEAQILAPLTVNTINGKDFTSFTNKIILKTHRGKITGKKTFTGGADLLTLIISKGTWNGLRFPQDFYTINDPVIVLDGQKSFAKLNAETVTAEETVDGIRTADLVSLSQSEVINSTWIFKGETKIFNDIFVEKTVDGILMESLLHQGILNSKESTLNTNADIIFNAPVRIENLQVDSTVNDKDFHEMFDNLIQFDDKEQCLVPGKTTVLCDTVFANMELSDNKINGFPIQNFLTKNTPQNITKPVTLSGPVFFQEIFALDRIDGVLVQDVLNKALRVSEFTAIDIPWNLRFAEIECKNSFKINGTINGVKSYGLNVARTRGPASQISQTFIGPIQMENPSFTKISTGQLTLDPGRTLQTLDVTMWSTTRAKLSEPTSFSQPFTINSVAVRGNMETKFLNGIQMTDFQDKILRSDKELNEFFGPITIKQGMTVLNGDIHFHKNVDGFALDDTIAHGFPLNARNDNPIILEEHWEFQSLKFDQGLEVTGDVCGVNLDRLQSDSVKRSEADVEIFGAKTFNQGITITGSLTLPQVNGKSLNNLFLLRTNQNIQSHGKFNGNVFKNILSAESINNLPISWLSNMYSFDNGRHILNHDVVVEDHLQTDSFKVSGLVQGKDFNKFLESTWRLSDSDIVFTDEVIMDKPILVEEDVETQFYNGINLNELFRQVVRLHEDVVIQQPVSFAHKIEAEDGLIVNGNLNAEQIANLADWNELMTKSIRIDDDTSEMDLNNIQFQHVNASGPLTVQNLNGINFDNYVMLNTKQDLGTLKISNANLNGSKVDINGKFGAFDISDEFEDTLMNDKEEPQRLAGSTVMKGTIHIAGDLECFGAELKDQIITTNEDLVIRGPVQFTSPVVVKKDIEINKPINGHTVQSIFNGAFSTDTEEQKISDLWEFRGPVTFKENFSGKGLADKINIQSLIAGKEEDLKEATKMVTGERNAFMQKCKALKDIRTEISKYPVKLESFEVHQVIGIKQEARHILAVDRGSTPLLFVQTTNCETSIYQWNPSSQHFEKVGNVPAATIGKVDSWQSISISDEESLIVLSQFPSDCSPLSGLHFVRVSGAGELSSLNTISSENVTSFKLVKKSDTATPSQILVFALFKNRDQEVDVFQWNQNDFSQTGVLQFSTVMERVDVAVTHTGFGIVSQSKEAIHMYAYSASPQNHRLMLEGSRHMLTSETGPMTVFESFGLKYALVSETGSSLSLIQPTCNFQVMRFQNGAVDPIQKLQVPEVLSATHFQFSDSHFMSFLSKSHGLFMYKFMGLNGFQQVNTSPYRIFGGLMLDSFSVKMSDYEVPHPFMLVLSQNRVEIYRGNVIGDKIMTNDFHNLCNI